MFIAWRAKKIAMQILREASDRALTDAIQANLVEFFALFRRWRKVESHDDAEMLWTITDIPFPLFNSVLRVQLAPARVDSAIAEVVARAKMHRVPVMWWTDPQTHPADLGTRLIAHGFAHEADAPGMALDLRALDSYLVAPDDFVTAQADDNMTTRDWCDVFVRGFALPNFTRDAFLDFLLNVGLGARPRLINYIGWLNGHAVATASVFYGAGVAGIYNVAVVPNARGKGIGIAITLAPLRDAFRNGYRVAILQSSKMGFSIYQRLGFREYCKIGHYVWSAHE